MLFIIWIICGVFAAVVASSKGRSGVAWFFLGFLFGPFALLASVGVTDLRRQRPPSHIPSESKPTQSQQRTLDKWKYTSTHSASPRLRGPGSEFDEWKNQPKACPYCAEDVKRLAKVCKHCGRDIEPDAIPPRFLKT